jgi:hypothetical protein
MVWAAAALVAAQVIHALVPVDSDHVHSEGFVGLAGGVLLVALSVAALVGLVQHRPYGRPLAAWTGLVVAVGFIAYHASPWTSSFTNPYLGKPVGVPAWISVALAIGAGAWSAIEGRRELGRTAHAERGARVG